MPSYAIVRACLGLLQPPTYVFAHTHTHTCTSDKRLGLGLGRVFVSICRDTHWVTDVDRVSPYMLGEHFRCLECLAQTQIRYNTRSILLESMRAHQANCHMPSAVDSVIYSFRLKMLMKCRNRRTHTQTFHNPYDTQLLIDSCRCLFRMREYYIFDCVSCVFARLVHSRVSVCTRAVPAHHPSTLTQRSHESFQFKYYFFFFFICENDEVNTFKMILTTHNVAMCRCDDDSYMKYMNAASKLISFPVCLGLAVFGYLWYL